MKDFEQVLIQIYLKNIIINFKIMKTFNNDMIEFEAAIFRGQYTDWNNKNIDLIVEEKINYVRKKYNTDILWLDKWREKWIEYLNSLLEDDIFNILILTKDKYIINFWEKYWYIAFSGFSWWLMEDWEKYSKIINKSIKINKFLLNEFNKSYIFYKKNHKYLIWKYILLAYKNLNIKINKVKDIDIYEYWENYYKPNDII